MTTAGCAECAEAIVAALESIERVEHVLPDPDTCRQLLAEPWIPAHHRARIEDILRTYEATG